MYSRQNAVTNAPPGDAPRPLVAPDDSPSNHESLEGQPARRGSRRLPQVAAAIHSLEQGRRQIESALNDIADQGVGPDDLPDLLDAIFELESLCADLSRRLRQSSVTVPPPTFSSSVELSPHVRKNNLSSALLDAAKAANAERK